MTNVIKGDEVSSFSLPRIRTHKPLIRHYLKHAEHGLASGAAWFTDYGVHLRRGIRALKEWMSIKEHGIQKYTRLIEQNVQQARFRTNLVDEAPELERLASVPLNIVCFRYNPGDQDENGLNEINQSCCRNYTRAVLSCPPTHS